MIKSIKLIISASALVFLLLAGCSNVGEDNITVPVDDNHTINVYIKDFSLQKVNDNKTTYLSLIDDHSYHYDIFNKKEQFGELYITTRTLDNGDVFIFSKLKNLTEQPFDATISIQLDEVNRYSMTDFEQRYVEHVHDGTIGVDKTTYPIGLVDALNYDESKYQLVFSKNYLSNELTTRYDNGLQSTLREFRDEKKKLHAFLANDSLKLEVGLQSNGEDISEGWILFSKDQLFKEEETLQQWIDYHIDQYKRANAWLTAEGPYKKLPWSIEPSTEMGYGRNLGIMQDKKALDSYVDSKERYFYDLVLNSVADLMHYKKEKKSDVWETEYTSTWLKRPYGLTAPFIDTRHNENIALFLTRVGHLLNNKELLESQLIYANYLVEQVEKGNVIKVNKGFLIADYFSPYDNFKTTHASLNHILGGMNFLLDSYIATENKSYLKIADKIHLGIEEIGDGWIRENGDLWYQVNPDLSLVGNDYELLTLEDLLNSQRKLEKAGKRRSEFLDKLIHSKASYLVGAGKTIHDRIIDELKRQGFREIITEEYLGK